MVVPEWLRRSARRVLRRPLNGRRRAWMVAQNRFPVAEGDVVVSGDSLAAGMPLLELFTPLRGRGLPGETIGQLHARLPDLLAAQPRRLIILVGTNDLLRGRGPERVAAGYHRLLTDAARLSGRTALVALSIPPMRAGWRQVPDAATVAEANRRLAAVAAAHGATFVDITSSLMDEHGQLREGLTGDGIHLTPEAYALVAPLLAEHLSA